MTAPAFPVCLVCRERAVFVRGCCTRCYDRHKRAVRAGATTWAALVAAGLALDVQPRAKRWRN